MKEKSLKTYGAGMAGQTTTAWGTYLCISYFGELIRGPAILLLQTLPRRQQMMTQVLGVITFTWEILTEFWALGFDLVRSWDLVGI